MAEGALPRDIWERSFEEGERRIKRRLPGQAATGLLGGFDVMIGLIVVVVLTGGLMTVTNAELAHAIGSLPFGIAFVFLTIGKAELFTENFLVPVGAWLAGRGRLSELIRLWGLTLLFNFAGIAIIAWLVTIDGVLPESAFEAAGELGQKFASRDIAEAFASAIVAGVAITLFTWLTIAAARETTRVILGLLIGYVLLLPVLNHAVVGFGELMIALMAGTAEASFGEVLGRVGIAVAGNTVGGIGLVTMTRLVQVSGEPPDDADTESERFRDRIVLPSRRSDR